MQDVEDSILLESAFILHQHIQVTVRSGSRSGPGPDDGDLLHPEFTRAEF